MTQLASPRAILIIAQTRRPVESAISSRPVGRVVVKGLADKIEVYEVLGLRARRRTLRSGASRRRSGRTWRGERGTEPSYEDLMRFAPTVERPAWHAKAMDVAERADLGSFIELALETGEIERLVKRLRATTDAAIEHLSHYRTEPAADHLAASHPDVAARVYRALGLRILTEKKSKHYDVAVGHFESAKRCYERSGRDRDWEALVENVRNTHHRKVGFMTDFERLVIGRGPSDEPSFLERARSRWSARSGS